MRCQIFRTARYATLARPMSALPPKADIAERDWHVRFVPNADSCTAAIRYSITSSARASRVDGMVNSSALAVLRLMISSNFVGACTGRSGVRHYHCGTRSPVPEAARTFNQHLRNAG